MLLAPILAKCPTCGSQDVFYSCHVTCCFNHVCNECRTTFELATDASGDRYEGTFPDPGERDTSLPMAPCAVCEKAEVYQLPEGGNLVCSSCRALLSLRYEKIVPDRKG
ncbi:MAG TPA: hypothetical protein VFX30_02470 [bacterium]|nr:hypothetical protein [bacterium]